MWQALPLAEATSINQTAEVLEQAGLTGVTVTPLLAALSGADHGAAGLS